MMIRILNIINTCSIKSLKTKIRNLTMNNIKYINRAKAVMLMLTIITMTMTIVGTNLNCFARIDSSENYLLYKSLIAASATTVTMTAPDENDDAKKADDKKAEEEVKDEYFALTNADVYTMTGPVLRGVTVLCKNGKIDTIAANVKIPEDAQILDVPGYRVYPGFIAVRSSGLVSGGDPVEGTDVYAMNLTLGLAAGITTVNNGNTAAKLTYGTLDDMIVKRDLHETLSYTTRNPAGRRAVREGLEKVRDHLRKVAIYEEEKRTNPDAEKPDDSWLKGEYTKYLRLLKGETIAITDANTTHEIRQICQLVEQYGIRVVVRGASEGWTIAPEMGRAGLSAIIIPRETRDPDPQLNRPTGTTIENAAILYNHGVEITFLPVGSWFGGGYNISLGGLAGRDLQHLPMEAAFSVRGGLSNEVAIKAITIEAAKILGVDDRIGSIEIGKDADFAICDGDPLHYMTQSRWTIVNGKIAYDKLKESLFNHIRPDGNQDAPPPVDYWPRALGQPW